MSPRCASGGVIGREAAGKKGGDETGEEVAGTATGESRISAGNDCNGAAWGGDERARTFEDDGATASGGEFSDGGMAVGLNVAYGCVEESGRLAGVGGKDGF